MPSFDLATGSESAQAQAQNPSDSGQNSSEPKRRKLDDQGGDSNNPNSETEVDGSDEKMEDRDDKAYMDLLAFLDSLQEEDDFDDDMPTYDPDRWVGCLCSICGKRDIHPTPFCPYLEFFPEDGKLAPAIVDMFGVELEKGPGRVVIDMNKLPAFSTPPQKTEDILIEIDRISRPDSAVIFQVDVLIIKMNKIVGAMRWDTNMVNHEDGALVPVLAAVKQYLQMETTSTQCCLLPTQVCMV